MFISLKTFYVSVDKLPLWTNFFKIYKRWEIVTFCIILLSKVMWYTDFIFLWQFLISFVDWFSQLTPGRLTLWRCEWFWYITNSHFSFTENKKKKKRADDGLLVFLIHNNFSDIKNFIAPKSRVQSMIKLWTDWMNYVWTWLLKSLL